MFIQRIFPSITVRIKSKTKIKAQWVTDMIINELIKNTRRDEYRFRLLAGTGIERSDWTLPTAGHKGMLYTGATVGAISNEQSQANKRMVHFTGDIAVSLSSAFREEMKIPRKPL